VAYDLVIEGGTVVDGTGGPAFRANVAVQGERIVAVGEVDGRGARTVDADGRVVTPGFVDAHTHLDAQIAWDPIASSSCWHGVTSVVLGNCGVTFAPCKPEDREYLAELMESVEDIPAASIDAMVALVDEAIAAGALGFSTSRTMLHRVPDGRAVPGTYAQPEELLAIAGVLGRHGRGTFEAAPRLGERDGDDLTNTRAEVGWMAEVNRTTGRPVTFGLAHSTLRPDLHARVLSFVDEMLHHPQVMLGLGDSGAHVGMIMDAGLPTFFLAHWVRDRGAFTLEDGIRGLTSDTATVFGIGDRGVIREGAFADMNVLDLEALRLPLPEYLHDFPGGAGRFVQTSEGYDCTIVNGQPFMEDGEHTGALAGTLLRSRTAPAAG
jgi:N-acyl-D-aspartate/D-glutamate deacylase